MTDDDRPLVEITRTVRVRVPAGSLAGVRDAAAAIGWGWLPFEAIPGDRGEVRVCVLSTGDRGEQGELLRLG